MIDEKKLIEDIKGIHYLCSGMRAGKTVLSNFAKQYREDVLKTIEEQPNVGQWIPCSERLPEEPVRDRDGYIVQAFANNEPFTAYWYGDGWEDDNGMEVYGIIAWQPLPEPYKESEEQHGTL